MSDADDRHPENALPVSQFLISHNSPLTSQDSRLSTSLYEGKYAFGHHRSRPLQGHAHTHGRNHHLEGLSTVRGIAPA